MKKKYPYHKLIDCAALKTPDGRVWTGKRHFHCFYTVYQATGQKAPQGTLQGFVTMHRTKKQPQGRFVNRKEARKLCVETGQIKTFCHSTELFSEDLY